MANEQEPTWSDIGVVAEAVSVLTNRADLSHDLLVELAGPLLRRLAVMVERIMQDPHGDSDASGDPDEDADRLDSPGIIGRTVRIARGERSDTTAPWRSGVGAPTLFVPVQPGHVSADKDDAVVPDGDALDGL